MRYIIILILIVFISGCACVGDGGRSDYTNNFIRAKWQR